MWSGSEGCAGVGIQTQLCLTKHKKLAAQEGRGLLSVAVAMVVDVPGERQHHGGGVVIDCRQRLWCEGKTLETPTSYEHLRSLAGGGVGQRRRKGKKREESAAHEEGRTVPLKEALL